MGGWTAFFWKRGWGCQKEVKEGFSSVQKHLEKCPHGGGRLGEGKEKPRQGSDAVLARLFWDHLGSVGLESDCLDLKPCSTISQLFDFGKATLPLWTSVFASIKCNNNSTYFLRLMWALNEIMHINCLAQWQAHNKLPIRVRCYYHFICAVSPQASLWHNWAVVNIFPSYWLFHPNIQVPSIFLLSSSINICISSTNIYEEHPVGQGLFLMLGI